jgi:non-heme chloroperoxidase
MATVTASEGTHFIHKDWGPKNAQPLIFHDGWPLTADD